MNALDLRQVSHLARRTGFAATTAQVELLMGANSQGEAIQMILQQPSSLLELPSWYSAPHGPRPRTEQQRMARRQQRREQSMELKFWWFEQMVKNTAPLQEKMTLFWANHFTSSLEKVKSPKAILNQNLLLRTHAIGSFRDMLAGIIRDPAMLVYLDNASSRKESPNENFARELLELFTLGEGNYSETDIKELARVLTGASVNRQTGNYLFKRRWHDRGTKTLFGETGAFGPDDAVDIILRQPSLGTFIAGKLWQFFVDDEPVQGELERLGKVFIDSNYSIAALLQGLLMQPEFWASAGEQIKSPMELLVGSIQLFNLALPSQRQVLRATAAMGQSLFDPPNVKGWPGGRAWYNSSTLAIREKVLGFVTENEPQPLPLEQMLAVDHVGRLPVESHPMYLPLAVHDPAYQVV